ncbi:MAG TPA: transglutaminase N-terminal domain-containing protein, partial [Chthoniobacterales bacterium]
MVFEILHTTDYKYSAKASEAYIETRLTPPLLAHQKVQSHRIEFVPDAPTSFYVDYFGNKVHFYSMTLRHERLTITNRLRVETRAAHLPDEALDVPLADARQIINCSLTDVFDYLQGTDAIPTGGMAKPWVRRFLKNGV